MRCLASPLTIFSLPFNSLLPELSGHSDVDAMLTPLRIATLVRYVETLENNLDLNLRVLRVVFMLIKICFMSHILGQQHLNRDPPCSFVHLYRDQHTVVTQDASGITWRRSLETAFQLGRRLLRSE